MVRKTAIGIQNFNEIIENNYFYVDKTSFIKEWWESGDSVTLITRPRRFGKTLTMSMVEQFFSVDYAGRGELFEGLAIWNEEEYRNLQGTYPVISLSFANVKEETYEKTKSRIYQLLVELYSQNDFLLESELLSDADKQFFADIKIDMPEVVATFALHKMAGFLYKHYGKKVIILLDEYDTPMQEAYVDGYWEDLVAFTRSMFNSTFKTNPWLERGIMTGITRVSKESIFSDLNHLKVVTSDTGIAQPYWVLADLGLRVVDSRQMPASGHLARCHHENTSSNSLISKLLQESDKSVKTTMEELLDGKVLKTQIDEQIVFSQLNVRTSSIWSFMLASGYLKAVKYFFDPVRGREEYELALTNKEVRFMFEYMIEGWFSDYSQAYNEFIKAMIYDDLDAMNEYMNKVALQTFSFFDTGAYSSEYSEPERFYHGFVLGIMVDLKSRYVITSNRESGFGRYDIILEPLSEQDNAIIIEFKVRKNRENNLEETLQNALKQIEEKQYEAGLIAKGIPAERIRKYGFAFEGKKVLIG